MKGYEALEDVLHRALDRAAKGKGKERHADGLPFGEQPWVRICERHGIGYPLGQVDKKLVEQYKLPTEQRIDELLDVIVYTAMSIIHIEKGGRDG